MKKVPPIVKQFKSLYAVNAELVQSANAFLVSADRLFDFAGKERSQGRRRFNLPIVPCIINMAFAAELYMKALIEYQTGKIRKSHRLNELFDELSQDMKQKVFQEFVQFQDFQSISEQDFQDMIHRLSNVFVDWRYIFEKEQDSTSPQELYCLAHALRSVSEKRLTI